MENELFFAGAGKERERQIENIYEIVFKALEKSSQRYEKNNDKYEFFGVAYKINNVQKDRMPENTGEIDDDMKTMVFACLNELADKYPNAVKIFYEEFFYDTDEYMREDILSIFQKYDQEERHLIFEKYGEYIDGATGSLDYMQCEFGTGMTVEQCYVEEFYRNSDSEDNYIKENKLHVDIAEHFSQKANDFLQKCATEDNGKRDVKQMIEKMDIEVEIFKEFFKQLKDIESDVVYNAKSSKFDICSGPKLSEEDKREIKRIYLENYNDFPQEFKDKIIEELEKRMGNTKARFYTLHHNDKIVAFNSCVTQKEGLVHFANFNVDSDYQFAKLGEAMMNISIDRESKKATIIAEAIPNAPITQIYLNKKGFEKVGEIEIGGVKLWKIKKQQEI